jgi:ABC-type siderophore export system fused ATPase/permease subunit
MKNDIKGTCQLSRKYFQILFMKVHIVQNLLVQHRKQGNLSAVERHNKNRKKNHKTLKKDDRIIRMKNMKGGNKKLLKKRLI